MSLYAIRPEFAGAIDATRFVAADEPNLEAVYRVGNAYFPASVFEALFQPVLPDLAKLPSRIVRTAALNQFFSNERAEAETALEPGQTVVVNPGQFAKKVTQADIASAVKDVLAKRGSLSTATIIECVATDLGIDSHLISESLIKGVKTAIGKLVDAGAVERSVAAPGQSSALMCYGLVPGATR